MIRNLKAMLLAALAATALLAVSASAAQGAARFTAPLAGAGATTTLKLDADGTGKTTHSVFDITNAAHTEAISFTCEKISGTGILIGPENTDATLTIASSNCTGAGQAITVTNTGCNNTFTANGEVHIIDQPGKLCEIGKDAIDLTFAGCKAEIGRQTLKGFKYHNLTNAGATVGNNLGNNVTVEASNIGGISYKAEGVACPYGTLSNGTLTTGNAIVTGTRPAGTAVDVRWDSV